MVLKQFQNIQLSALGMGMMRLPEKEGADGSIDEEKTIQMFDYAIEHGINYFDTAWGYHNGQSEIMAGKILSRYPRESYYLADKFPGYDLSNMYKVEEIFEKQLKRCKTDYFDFYLFHNVCEMNIEPYLDKKYGIMEYLLKQKEAGKIRHLGFSAHGNCDVMKCFLETYGKYMEFCQIQLNYVDWNFQNAREKVDLLHEYKLPVWVMEPLRGGMLASLSEEDTLRLSKLRPAENTPAWAFRFLQTIPGVTVVLSGMSDFSQVKENISVFEEENPLSTEEFRVLTDIADTMVGKTALACTSCRYCVSHCPRELDIPSLLSLYNEHCFTKGGFIAPMALSALPGDKWPSSCIGCQSCEAVCPQQLKISEAMGDFSKRLNG